MAFLLKGVAAGVGIAVEENVLSLDFDRLASTLRLDQLSINADAGTGGDAAEKVVVEIGQIYNDLYVVDRGAVVECDEGYVFIAPLSAYPAFDIDGRIYERFDGVTEKMVDFYTFHVMISLFFLYVMGLTISCLFYFVDFGEFCQFHVGGEFHDAFLLVTLADEDGFVIAGHDIVV